MEQMLAGIGGAMVLIFAFYLLLQFVENKSKREEGEKELYNIIKESHPALLEMRDNYFLKVREHAVVDKKNEYINEYIDAYPSASSDFRLNRFDDYRAAEHRKINEIMNDPDQKGIIENLRKEDEKKTKEFQGILRERDRKFTKNAIRYGETIFEIFNGDEVIAREDFKSKLRLVLKLNEDEIGSVIQILTDFHEGCIYEPYDEPGLYKITPKLSNPPRNERNELIVYYDTWKKNKFGTSTSS